MRTIIASLALGTAVTLGFGGMAAAQTQPPAQQPTQQAPAPQQAPGQQQVSDQQIQVFASALQKVQEIVVAYGPQIEKAKDLEQAQKLHTEAQDKMAQAVKSEGLSVQQYNQVAKLAESDPQVRSRIKAHMSK